MLKFRKGEKTHITKTKKGGAKLFSDKKLKKELCYGDSPATKRVGHAVRRMTLTALAPCGPHVALS